MCMTLIHALVSEPSAAGSSRGVERRGTPAGSVRLGLRAAGAGCMVFALLIALWLPSPVSAQTFDSVGTRARGMAGAFVAVADDASATWWNPAGLATGASFNTILERGQIREPDRPPLAGPAWRDYASGFAIGYPALGLSYYRQRVSSIGPSPPDRQDRGTESLALRSFSMTSYGATFGQSVGNHLVVASTFRLVRAGAILSDATPSADLLDRADDLEGPRQTLTDVDLGAMVRAGSVRVGATLKHVNEPSVGTGAARLTLARQARVGLAVVRERRRSRGSSGLIDAWTIAADADMTDTPTVYGAERRLAVGGEAWVFGRRMGLRGGVSTSTVGARRTFNTSGASVALRRGMFVDAALIPGSDAQRSGWSISLRSSF